MKAITLGFALGAAMLGGLCTAQAQQVVRAGYLPYTPPTQLHDLVTHAPSGAAVDLMTAVAKDAGFTVEYHVMNVGDLIPAIKANLIDVAVGQQFTQAFRDQGMIFSDPIWNNAEGLFVAKGDARDYKSMDDLKGEVIGTVTGGPYDAPLKATGLFKEVKTYATAAPLFQAVASGEIKAGFQNGLTVSDVVRTNAYPGIRQPAGYQARFTNGSGIMGGAASADTLKKINVSLAKLKADGTIKTIFAKYGADFALVK